MVDWFHNEPILDEEKKDYPIQEGNSDKSKTWKTVKKDHDDLPHQQSVEEDWQESEFSNDIISHLFNWCNNPKGSSQNSHDWETSWDNGKPWEVNFSSKIINQSLLFCAYKSYCNYGTYCEGQASKFSNLY